MAKFEWKDPNGKVLASEINPSVTCALGTHTVSLQVTDNSGAIDSADVVIAVNSIVGGSCTTNPNPGTGTGSANPVATAPNPNLTADLAAINNLQPGQWYEVRNSRMSVLDPCPARNQSDHPQFILP